MQNTAIEIQPNESTWMQKIMSESPFATSVVIGHLAMILICLIGLAFDDRTLLGESVWIKPTKFAISGGVYCATIVWLMTFTKRGWVSNLILGGNAFLISGETIIIALQAARGLRSHYNVSTPLDATLWGMMGSMIGLMWVLNFIFIFYLLFQPIKDKAFKSALVWGVIIAFVGGLTGFFMTNQQTPAQSAQIASGESPDFVGGHTFGAEDGGEGLPFVGWSTTHGDMRPAHFFGLHGLQLIPLLGLAINRRYSTLTDGRRMTLVFIGSLAYLGLVIALAQQALNQLPITSFDGLTMTILSLVTLSSATLWLIVVRGGNHRLNEKTVYSNA